jgi:glycosyltransferase involved in cell wall biosynthesis
MYLMIAKLFQRKVIYQVHGGSLEKYVGKEGLFWWFADWVFGMSDAVVVLSSAEEANFKKLRRVKRLTVIRNAVDLSEFGSRNEGATSKMGKRFVYLGRLTREKGLFEALEAMRIVASDPAMKQVELLIAGSGPARNELARRIAEADLDSRVKLVEPVFGAQKVQFLEEADVFLFPSYHEGLPYAVLESLAAGTPVIATRVGGIPDVVVDQVHGVLIDPRDSLQIVEAIKTLASRNDLVTTMSQNCRKRAREEFGLDRLAREFGDLYSYVMEKQNRVSQKEIL